MLETVIPLHYQDESFDVYKRICNNNRGAANALWRFAIITFISSYGARSFAPKALRIFRRGDIFSAPYALFDIFGKLVCSAYIKNPLEICAENRSRNAVSPAVYIDNLPGLRQGVCAQNI